MKEKILRKIPIRKINMIEADHKKIHNVFIDVENETTGEQP
jgi:hypothetical protein